MTIEATDLIVPIEQKAVELFSDPENFEKLYSKITDVIKETPIDIETKAGRDAINVYDAIESGAISGIALS